jgi:hypothetical protein
VKHTVRGYGQDVHTCERPCASVATGTRVLLPTRCASVGAGTRVPVSTPYASVEALTRVRFSTPYASAGSGTRVPDPSTRDTASGHRRP